MVKRDEKKQKLKSNTNSSFTFPVSKKLAAKFYS